MLKFIARLMRFSGKDAWKLKLAAVISFIEGILQNVPIFAALLVIIRITDRTLVSGDALYVFAVLLASIVLRWILRRIFVGLESDTAVYVASRERVRIGDLFKRFPMSYFTDGNIGNVTSVITGDLSFAEDYGMTKLDEVISGLISLVIGCLVLLWADWRLALAALVTCTAAMLVFRIMERLAKEKSKIRQEQAAKLTGAALEYAEGISVIKALRMTGSSAKRMDSTIDETCRQAIGFERSLLWPVVNYVNCYSIAIAAVIFIAFTLCFGGELTLPTAFMTVLFVFQVFRPAMALATSATMMRVMEAGLDRYEKLKEVPIIDADGKDADLHSFDIEFNSVTFSYDEKETLKNITFTAKERSMTALVGASGSGKTTIANLIARFWDAQKGSIRIGGQDIRGMTCDSLLRCVSMVFQRVYLFNDTIGNNIKFGRPDATDEEIIDAAKKARCHDFITALPNGYDTRVGDGGSTLSGGEKQRVSIARAILKNAPIVLLDEATAGVDPDNEKFIQEAIDELVRDKTLIIIAHRLSTIKNADLILVLQNGEIVERGVHSELIKLNGQYTNLWNRRSNAKSWRITR
ncbi:MAG: ABC transporter ATP-binding protein/permease [Oscillospiraceae bacterium]|jgi:ATP-binding cassette subfamily B protein|nr:ABC transporter ATP-binding protein/permease [Oscillospiraceae bacterium]